MRVLYLKIITIPLCNIMFLKSIQLPNTQVESEIDVLEAHTVLYGSGEKGVSLNLLGVPLNSRGCRSITLDKTPGLSWTTY